MRSPQHILWQSEDGIVTLFDVPGSIAAAQGTSDQPFDGHLVTSEPLQSPFASNEPKAPAARAQLALTPADQLKQDAYRRLLGNALEQVRSHHSGPWCLPRPYTIDTPRTRKRKADVIDAGPLSPSAAVPPPMSDIFESPVASIVMCAVSHMNCMIEGEMCKDRFKFYTGDDAASHDTEDKRPRYRMPARSCAVLDDCANSGIFHKAVTLQAGRDSSRPEFDFILLDPPWPSRSVKRTHKTAGSTYPIVATLKDLKRLLLGTRVDALMEKNCLVGIWITNKPAVRELVLGDDGIFGHWGLKFTEEWLWLKTTLHGEPVTQLDGLWRKPYEVFLLGRKQDTHSACSQECNDVLQRVIVAVPDIHSRKPCLKSLIEPKMPNVSNYRALEIFARHLVAGWWSWGNECIRFNWEGCWRR